MRRRCGRQGSDEAHSREPEQNGRAFTVVTAYSDRVCAPEETWEKVHPLFARFGITRLARLTDLDRIGIPVWSAVTPNARSIVITQGKGITDIDAKVSAAMEAFERAVAGDPQVGVHRSSQDDLVSANTLCLTLDEHVAAGEAFVAKDETIDWFAGYDLETREPVLVPRDAVRLDRTGPKSRFWQSSDGLASGNTQQEAILHGLLERIERDADRLWRLLPPAKRLATAIDPASLGDPIINGLVKRFEGAGVELRLFDITSDLLVPTYAAVLGDIGILQKKTPLFHDATIGYGTHPVAHRAAIRALTEVAQSRLTYISGARDDFFAETFTRPLAPETIVLFRALPGPAHRYPVPEENGAAKLLVALRAKLKAAGIGPVVAVPLTDGSLPLSVVKVVVPGLENPEGPRRQAMGRRALSAVLLGSR